MANADRFRNRGRARTAIARSVGRDDYWYLSTRPLHAFMFLLPLVTLYELGSVFYLHDLDRGIRTTVRAENLLRVFFENLGVLGLLVPGLTVLLVLLIWHVVVKDRWQFKPVIQLGMLLEAGLWAMPLLVLAAMLEHARTSGVAAALTSNVGPALTGFTLIPAAGVDGLLAMPWPARATVSLGAGIYEELVFRLAGLALCHAVLQMILCTWLKLKDYWPTVLSVAITAIAFAFYHDVLAVNGRPIGAIDWLNLLARGDVSLFIDAVKWRQVLFFVIAGAYFAGLYLWRGFGIVVGTHAAYDLAVLVFLVR